MALAMLSTAIAINPAATFSGASLSPVQRSISAANSGKFRIMDVSGKVVKEVFVKDDATTVDVSGLETGVYVLVNAEGTTSFRLMKI